MTEAPPEHVALLSVDALRADHLSSSGYHRETSPRLDELANRGVAFSTATSASGHTREAVPSLLTGRHPTVFAASGFNLATESLAGRLSKSGFATAGFHSNPYVSRAYGYDRGFDEFFDDLLLGRNRFVALAQRAIEKFVLNRGAYHARASEINDRSLAWIDSLDGGRFFLWNHYMDVHGPYNPPAGHAEFTAEVPSDSDAQRLYQKSIERPSELTEREHDLLVDCYDDEVRYLDAQIGAFVDGLRSRGLLDETLLVVTADHGDGFGEHGYYAHPRRLHDELLRVPLILPTVRAGDRIDAPASTLDVAPTVLDAVGIDPRGLPGTPLLGADDWRRISTEHRPDVAFSATQGEDEDANTRHFCVRDREWKVLATRHVESGKVLAERAFDLEADPGENNPLTPSRVDDDRVQALRERLREHADARLRSFGTEVDRDEVTVEGEIESRLESLGYR